MDKGIVRHNIGLDPEFERKLEGPVCRQVVAGPRNQPATRNSRAAFWARAPCATGDRCHPDCHSRRATPCNWPLLTATSDTDQQASKCLRRRSTEAIDSETYLAMFA